MRIVFFATAEFAIPSLRALINSKHEVVALVTQPDKPRGRNLKLSPPAPKVIAQTHGIPIYQPVNASSHESIEYLKSLSSDLFVVIAFGQILKKDALSVPKHCSINLHGSLLPRYRGASPTNWAVINGDAKTGVTIIRMNERMDEGDILMKSEMAIEPDDTNITVNEKLSDMGAKVLLDSIDLIERGSAVFEKQDPSKATYVSKLKKEDGLIDWDMSADRIHNRVRGLLPWPGAYTHYDGKILKILKTEPVNFLSPEDAISGEVLNLGKGIGMIVNTGLGAISVKYVQLQGGKVLDIEAFLRGHKIEAGYRFK